MNKFQSIEAAINKFKETDAEMGNHLHQQFLALTNSENDRASASIEILQENDVLDSFVSSELESEEIRELQHDIINFFDE